MPHHRRQQNGNSSSTNPTDRPQIDIMVTPEQYARLQRVRIPHVRLYRGTEHHIRDFSQAFIREATLSPD